jgi:hypothetical protein
MVNSSYYSSPWFITIFTNSLQSMQDDHSLDSSRILELWDYFLTVRLSNNYYNKGWMESNIYDGLVLFEAARAGLASNELRVDLKLC